ncbi:MAG: polyphosphate kinase 2 family protein [Bacteroidales bacterium]|nr:polyphosphate kinase 2 family protein [Bacteroidales bacterium]
MKDLSSFLATPGKKHKESDFKCDYATDITKEQAETELQNDIAAISRMQEKLYADGKTALLIVFQAMDAAGKDGTIKNVMSGINPQGCRVATFKTPTKEELAHDFLWRINKQLPEKGMIGIFNRSHYEEVLINKVHPENLLAQSLPGIQNIKDIGKTFWMKRYENINAFEKLLVENGTVIIKFFLHVSKEEQKKRFLKRIEEENHNWKFSQNDITERKYWKQYMDAYSDMLTYTSTGYAPWHVIPADKKWFMRLVVGQIIRQRMEQLDLHFPKISDENKEFLGKAKDILENEK